MCGRIRHLLNKNKSGSLQCLMIPDPDDLKGKKTKGICNHAKINKLRLERNRKHFSQLRGTPFTSVNLVSLFRRQGDAKTADDPVAGMFPEEDDLAETPDKDDNTPLAAAGRASRLEFQKANIVLRHNKLPVIHLFKAHLNLLFGIAMGRRSVWHLEDFGVNGDKQWESQPDRSCENLFLLKTFACMPMRMTRAPGAMFDNDAKSCFDRIAMCLASLRSRHLGVPAKVCAMTTKFLQTTACCIKTIMEHLKKATSAPKTVPCTA